VSILLSSELSQKSKAKYHKNPKQNTTKTQSKIPQKPKAKYHKKTKQNATKKQNSLVVSFIIRNFAASFNI
jgi:hypothetical protein